ncbi:MAG: hypothetical protein NTW25_00535 [Candidatus Kapabacteria bacterium]|nr:hypothetical protein [Candidatus Kapabacteria bacterium]
MSKKLSRDIEREPWERLPDESIHCFEMFKYFLSLGYKGKVYEVATYFNAESASDTYKHSHNYNWIDRRRKWLDHLNLLQIQETEKTVKEMARRHASNSMLNESALMMPVKIFMKQLQTRGTGELEEMSMKDLLRFVYQTASLYPTTVSTERMARGQATEISKSELAHSGDMSLKIIKPTIHDNIDNDEL